MEFIDFRIPAQGFSQPLMLWTASHDRAQRVVLLLQRLFEHLRQHGPSQATRVTAAEVCRFMDESTPRHNEDEDIDLFPRLRRRLEAANGSAFDPTLAHETALTIERLERDHPILDDMWTQVRAALVHADSASPTDAHCACAEQFVGTFLAHHGVEEQLITPIAERALMPADLAAIGEAMAARRGTTWAALSLR